MFENFEVIIVGSGFFGATIAERITSETSLKVAVVEARNHVGGNSYSEIEQSTGIEYHKYGSHIFHTNSDKVWEYVNRFTKFNNYRHKVFSKHNDEIYSLPINLSTINQFYKKTYSPDQARKKIQEVQVELTETLGENFEGKAISLMGTDLYNAFFKNYTFKQWQTDPRKLPKSTITRLPFRFNYNNDYFDDKYQGIPLDGYTNWITKLLSKTTVFLNTDFLKIKSQITQDKLIIYTGPIDKYFNYQFGELAWRTLDFKLEIKKLNDFQGNSVINYADLEVDYTRIHEFKHLHPERNYQENSTLIMYEFSKFADRIDEPYYPVNSESDKLKLSKYRALIKNEKNTFFGGRLGSYQYLDMHMAIASALAMFENEIIVRLNELRLI